MISRRRLLTIAATTAASCSLVTRIAAQQPKTVTVTLTIEGMT